MKNFNFEKSNFHSLDGTHKNFIKLKFKTFCKLQFTCRKVQFSQFRRHTQLKNFIKLKFKLSANCNLLNKKMREKDFHWNLLTTTVSDVSGFLIRRQNRPDILSAGEEVQPN